MLLVFFLLQFIRKAKKQINNQKNKLHTSGHDNKKLCPEDSLIIENVLFQSMGACDSKFHCCTLLNNSSFRKKKYY